MCHLFEPHPERLFFGGHGGVFIVWIKAEYVSGFRAGKNLRSILPNSKKTLAHTPMETTRNGSMASAGACPWDDCVWQLDSLK